MAKKSTKPAGTGSLQGAAKDLSLSDAVQAAKTYYANGDLGTAEKFCRQILEQVPNQADTLCILGVIAHQTGKSEQAIELINQAISHEPDFPDAHNNLGEVYRAMARYEEARACFEKAIDLNPGFSEAYNNLGAVLKQGKRPDLATQCFNKAIELKPDYADPYTNLGNIYDDMGQHDEAISHHRKAIAINPRYVLAYRNLGKVLHNLGRLDEAMQAYRQALELSPDEAEIHRQMSRIKRFDAVDDDVRAMEKTYARADLAEEKKMYMCFSLGKAYEDIGDFDKSFEFYRTGNTLKRKTFDFSIGTEADYIGRVQRTFTDELFGRFEGSGVQDTTPIFIVGMPRSGTTLVEQILASHPDVYGAGELSIAIDLVHALTLSEDNRYPENLARMEAQSFTNMAGYYLENLRRYSTDAKRITDKMPGNFLQVGLIKLMLPKAKVVHCRRNPMDTCLSIYKNLFADGHFYSNDLEELGAYYNLYRTTMAHWENALPGFVHHVSYENLVQDMEPNVRDLLDYCDLDWHPDCLEFHKTERNVNTASAVQVRQPLYSGSIDSWKKFEHQLTPLLDIIDND